MQNDIIIPDEARIRYLERRKKDVESLRAAVNSRSLEEFKRIGHQLKGNAASFGYSELEKVAVQLEVAGEHEDVLEATKQLENFERWLNGKMQPG